eukprot:JP448170.1.p1 GENE.JP448170.1~~JP448170.1.p1  ORF type:complete len:72 (+),score=1.95 JP448170.1:120-335(+)
MIAEVAEQYVTVVTLGHRMFGEITERWCKKSVVRIRAGVMRTQLLYYTSVPVFNLWIALETLEHGMFCEVT